MARQRLGEILVTAGLLKKEQVENALREQQRWGGQLGQILVGKNYITEESLVSAPPTSWRTTTRSSRFASTVVCSTSRWPTR